MEVENCLPNPELPAASSPTSFITCLHIILFGSILSALSVFTKNQQCTILVQHLSDTVSKYWADIQQGFSHTVALVNKFTDHNYLQGRQLIVGFIARLCFTHLAKNNSYCNRALYGFSFTVSSAVEPLALVSSHFSTTIQP